MSGSAGLSGEKVGFGAKNAFMVSQSNHEGIAQRSVRGTSWFDSVNAKHSPVLTMKRCIRVRMRVVDIIVTGGTKGWIKNAGASWVAIPPDKLAELMKDAPLKGYFTASGLSDLQCRGIQVVDGMPRLTFTYNAVISGRKAMVTAYFDPDSRRPVAGESIIDTGGTKARTVTSYTFDRAIRIAPPAP